MSYIIQENGRATKKTIGLLALVLFLWLVLEMTSNLYLKYINILFDLDNYMFFEAGRELISSGVSKLAFIPNSTQGWDVYLWSYYLPPYLYAIAIELFNIQFYDTVIIYYIQFIIVLFVLFAFVVQFMTRFQAFIFTCLIVYEPLFRKIIFKDYHLLASIFAMLSLLFLFGSIQGNGKVRVRDYIFFYLSGFSGMATFLSFVGLGLPILIGLTIAFIIENLIRGYDKKVKLYSAILFFAGIVTPFIIFGIDIYLRLDSNNLYSLFTTLTYYTDVAVPSATSFRTVLKTGYFISGMIVSPYTLTILPVGITAMIFNIYQWKLLGGIEKIIVRITMVFTITWILLGLLVPHHITSFRMILLLPLFMLQIILVFKYREKTPFFHNSLIILSMVFLSVQGLYHTLGRPWEPYGIGVAAVISLILSSICILFLQLYKRNKYLRNEHINLINYKVILAIIVIMLIPVCRRNYLAINNAVLFLSENDFSFKKKPLSKELASYVRTIALKELKSGDRVLTNMPMREFFGDEVNRQLIRFYRGLANGATVKPADKVFLFGRNPTENIYPKYKNVKVKKNIYYRAFIYHIDKRIELTRNFYVLIGSPVKAYNNKIIYPTDYVPKEEVEKYLNWRISNGLI